MRAAAADISNVLWCYANLGRAPPAPLANGFVSLAWRLLSKKGRGPESQAESNILWSLAKLSALDPALRPPQRRLEEFEAFSAGGLSQYTGQASGGRVPLCFRFPGALLLCALPATRPPVNPRQRVSLSAPPDTLVRSWRW